MDYRLEIKPSCQKSITKACHKNLPLRRALEKKIRAIQENPEQYKPLRKDLAGQRRVHILKSFVLRYEISSDVVTLLSFSHHDEAYER
jgi:YafQ family addiction module toxin component